MGKSATLLRNFRPIQKIFRHKTKFGCRAGTANDTASFGSSTRHLAACARSATEPAALYSRTSHQQALSALPVLFSPAVAHALAQLQFPRHTHSGALKDILPFRIHSKHNVPADADPQQVAAAYGQLNSNPLWRFTTLDDKPLGEVTFDNNKRVEPPGEGGMLAYAQLAYRSTQPRDTHAAASADADAESDDGSMALYAFAQLDTSTTGED